MKVKNNFMKLPILSILDSDLYKFSMQMAVLKLFPNIKVKYKFYNRGKTIFPAGFAEQLRILVKEMETLALTKEEKEFLVNKTGHYLDPVYLDFLEGYRFNSNEVGIIQNGGDLEIQISGYWFRTILWEVPLMALISELYFYMTGEKIDSETVIKQKTQKKAISLKTAGAYFAEFGARRRYSFENQLMVTKELKEYGGQYFVGTSNVYIAFLLNVNPIGTMAHEWIMAHAAMYGFNSANFTALKSWKKVYKGYLGTSLSDTYTTKDFFRSFGKEYAELFTGIRQDSGDPIEFAKHVIEHYKTLGIDPTAKTIVFSDALDVEKVNEIMDFCRGKIKSSYGIGTNFSNDVGVKALNIVIKIDEVELQDGLVVPTVKLSDSSGKHTGNKEMIKLCLLTLGLLGDAKSDGFIDDAGYIKIDTTKIYTNAKNY
jgi:nicotinate phosphoribosyltransferase